MSSVTQANQGFSWRKGVNMGLEIDSLGILRRYVAWRQGDGGLTMPEAGLLHGRLTEALVDVVAEVERLRVVEDLYRQTLEARAGR